MEKKRTRRKKPPALDNRVTKAVMHHTSKPGPNERYRVWCEEQGRELWRRYHAGELRSLTEQERERFDHLEALSELSAASGKELLSDAEYTELEDLFDIRIEEEIKQEGDALTAAGNDFAVRVGEMIT